MLFQLQTTRPRKWNRSPFRVLVLLMLVMNMISLQVSHVKGTLIEVPAVLHGDEEPVQADAEAEASTSTSSGGMKQDEQQDSSDGPVNNSGNSNSNNSNNNHQHSQGEETHCAWGTACHQDSAEGSSGQEGEAAKASSSSAVEEENETMTIPNTPNNASGMGSTSGATGDRHIPFVHHHPHNPAVGAAAVAPPEGFAITARVYTNPNDKLSHFTDDQEGSHITLPYWECGATGSTTSPLPVKHAYFRHALAGSKPQVWSGAEYGPHPQLLIVLKPMEMVLNSGEAKVLRPGDVVLLEDVVSGGHKFKSAHSNSGSGNSGGAAGDMTFIVLTLPQHYHHVGRDRMSLKKASMEKKVNPCTNDITTGNNNNEQAPQRQRQGNAFVSNKTTQQPQQQQQDKPSWDRIRPGHTSSEADASGDRQDGGGGEVAPLKEGKVRKLLLGAIGLSISTLMADFLGKVAPLWLAVGIGGTCFVVGGTIGIVQGGDHLWTEIEMWQERKRLAHPGGVDSDALGNSGDGDKDDDDEIGLEPPTEAMAASS